MTAELSDLRALSFAQSIENDLRRRTLLPIKATFERIDRDTDSQFEKIFSERVASTSASQALQNRVRAEFIGLGPLEALLEDEEITEVIVTGHKSIFYEKHGRLWPSADRFVSEQLYQLVIARISSQIHNSPDSLKPFADGRLANHRVHIASSWATHDETQLTLRRIRRNPWTLDELARVGAITPDQLNELQNIVHNQLNTIVIGSTGSGKTSLLQSLLQETDPDCRTVIIEDTHELSPPSLLCSRLLTRAEVGHEIRAITMSDLVKQSLRMRPDRICVGEVRSGEAKDLLLALATGHRGSMGTLHANHPRDAMDRLCMLVQMGAPEWNDHTVRRLIQSSIDVVITVARRKDGSRGVERIDRLTSVEQSGFCFEPYSATSMKLPGG